jgi:hypothetical protein
LLAAAENFTREAIWSDVRRANSDDRSTGRMISNWG